ATQFRHWRTGKVLAQSPLGQAVQSRYGAPYYHMHRGDLMAALLAAAKQHPNIELHPGTKAESFAAEGEQITLHTSQGVFTGDLLLGADGIHSTVSQQLWGASQPSFTGNIAWRALVPAASLPSGLVRPVTSVWWGPGRHLVHYYVRRGELVNCVGVVEKQGWQVESWTEPGDLAELTADFAGWHSDIQCLLQEVDQSSLYKWALFDRKPMDNWGQGRVTLLGDACHSTLPFMAQGAAMAIEDAAVLAACLEQGSDVATALQGYEALRRTRTRSVQLGSRRNASLFHLSGIRAWLRNRAARSASGRSMDRLFRYDALGQEMPLALAASSGETARPSNSTSNGAKR
ncbi:MAG: FAD-dependent monooxygenase, partial [Pseudomonadales bacterium]